MEKLISKAKLFLEAYSKAHPILCTGSEKDVACYMAYHELKNAIKEQEEKSIIETIEPQLQQADVMSSLPSECLNGWENSDYCMEHGKCKKCL